MYKRQGEELLNIIINGGFYEYKLTSKERQFIIKLLLFINNDHLTLSDFEKILFTSKVTVYKDLKKVSAELEKNDIKLNENKRFGFLLDMDAVSYTHLDVYKRQITLIAPGIAEKLHIISNKHIVI